MKKNTKTNIQTSIVG